MYLRPVVMRPHCYQQDTFLMEPLQPLIMGSYQILWTKANVAVSSPQVRCLLSYPTLKILNMDYNQYKFKIYLKCQLYQNYISNVEEGIQNQGPQDPAQLSHSLICTSSICTLNKIERIKTDINSSFLLCDVME